jgi:hypothetical protein
MCAAMNPRATAVVSVAALILALGAGCGKAFQRQAGEGSIGSVATMGPSGAIGLVTKNTTRIGGASPVVDAAAVARAVYPALTPSTRPQAVVLVDQRDWPAALVASVLAGGPLRAPLLYTEGAVLPAVSDEALGRLAPTGARALEDVQAVRVGLAAAPPELRLRSVTGADPSQLAVAMERIVEKLQGGAPGRVIVTAADAPPAMTAPAAGLAAQTGAPILLVERSTIPSATREALVRLGRPSIYVVGPKSVVGDVVVGQLGRLGAVTRIGGDDPTANAIAVARFTDGSFGWGVREPGHGLVFADASRPLDGPATAALSANGDYAPLLLLEGSGRMARALERYVSDLQPGSPPSGPVRGVYNHGWLIGDERAIPVSTQAALDAILEISPSVGGVEPTLSQPTTASEP